EAGVAIACVGAGLVHAAVRARRSAAARAGLRIALVVVRARRSVECVARRTRAREATGRVVARPYAAPRRVRLALVDIDAGRPVVRVSGVAVAGVAARLVDAATRARG